MKKLIALFLSVVLALVLFGCKKNDGDLGKQTTIDKQNGYTLVEEVKVFKMNDDERAMKKLDDVQKDGFKTSEETKTGEVRTKSDAISIAKKEIDTKYNSIRVAFDRTQGIWKITFSNDVEKIDNEGMKHIESDILKNVYVDEDGYTLFICNGEVK